jgi:hypothetical protein
MMEFISIECDWYLFVDMHKHEKRLNLAAHGGSRVSASARIFGEMKTAEYIADLLAKEMQPHFSLEHFRYIRLIICHSAAGDIDSLVCQLSRKISHAFVKGYKSRIWVRSVFNVTNTWNKKDTHGLSCANDYFIAMEYKNMLKKTDHFTESATYKNGHLIQRSSYADGLKSIDLFL